MDWCSHYMISYLDSRVWFSILIFVLSLLLFFLLSLVFFALFYYLSSFLSYCPVSFLLGVKRWAGRSAALHHSYPIGLFPSPLETVIGPASEAVWKVRYYTLNPLNNKNMIFRNLVPARVKCLSKFTPHLLNAEMHGYHAVIHEWLLAKLLCPCHLHFQHESEYDIRVLRTNWAEFTLHYCCEDYLKTRLKKTNLILDTWRWYLLGSFHHDFTSPIFTKLLIQWNR